jgi:general secretion pathway protein C
MLIFLHSFYRPICLTLLAVLGLACGHLVDTVLQMKLRPEFAAATTSSGPATDKEQRIVTADLDLILQKNLFDASNRSSSAVMSGDLVTADGEPGGTAAPRADIKLIGTVVAGEDSQALLAIDNKLDLYHLGEKLPDNGTLDDIQRHQVKIKYRDQRVTVLTLYEQSSTEASSRPSEPVSSPPVSMPVKPGGTIEAVQDTGANGDIREVGENRWLVSKQAVESVRENFAAQMRLVQMQPRMVDGKIDGFLVQRINPRSMLAKLGLKRGDVVIDVNNTKLDSPEKALVIFQQLREARQIGLSIERNGSPLSFSYEIE